MGGEEEEMSPLPLLVPSPDPGLLRLLLPRPGPGKAAGSRLLRHLRGLEGPGKGPGQQWSIGAARGP